MGILRWLKAPKYAFRFFVHFQNVKSKQIKLCVKTKQLEGENLSFEKFVKIALENFCECYEHFNSGVVSPFFHLTENTGINIYIQ